ncbi:MAG: hypothetical protein RL301_247 [Actinomycetota bacterium]|jgi:mannose-1-phosphate guanylyltransferase
MSEGILLVGGLGTRLRPLTNDLPKPMLPIATLPVTEHQIAMAKRAGVTRLVLATSYLSDVFKPYFGDGKKWGIEIDYAVEKEPLGTGGAIRNAAELLSGNNEIIIFNGDVLSSHNLNKQIAQHKETNAAVTLHLTPVEDARAYGSVPTDDRGRVTAFLEKMDQPPTKNINAGCYVFAPSVMNTIPLGQVVSVERETFPNLISSGELVFGYIDQAYWLDIGTPAALMKGSKDLVIGLADADALNNYQFVHRGKDYVAAANSMVAGKISGGTSIGANSQIAAGAKIESSIICEGVRIGSSEINNSFIAPGAEIGDGVVISGSYVAKSGEIFAIFD